MALLLRTNRTNILALGKSIGAGPWTPFGVDVGVAFGSGVRSLLFVHKRYYPGAERGHVFKVLGLAHSAQIRKGPPPIRFISKPFFGFSAHLHGGPLTMMSRTSTSVCRPLQYSYAAFKHQSQRTFLRVNDLEKSDSLILGFAEKKTIPGIMSLCKKEREYLQEISKDSIYGEYRMAIMVRQSKVIFNAFVIRHQTLYDCIRYTLDKLFIPVKDPVKSREIIKILTNKKEITLMQNLLCVTFGHKKIPFDIFEKYCLLHGVNPQSYKGGTVTIQAFAEVKILSLAFFLDKKEYANVMFYIINSTNLLRGFDVTESNHFLGQDHADFLIVNRRNNLVEKIYADVKTYTHNGIDKHHVSIFQGNKFDYNQEINNIITSIDRYIAREKFNAVKFKFLSNELKSIKKETKGSAETCFKIIYEKLVSVFLNPYYRELRLSLSAAITGEDVLFETFFEKSIKPFIEQKKENTSLLADLFPPNSVLTEDQHKKVIHDFVDHMFEPTLALEIKGNISRLLDNNLITNQTC